MPARSWPPQTSWLAENGYGQVLEGCQDPLEPGGDLDAEVGDGADVADWDIRRGFENA
jgi:hypothetical protein